MCELSQVLMAITGDAGTRSFAMEDLRHPRARLLVARDAKGVACACGALRPLDDLCGEIKRMYARTGSAGAGSVEAAHITLTQGAWIGLDESADVRLAQLLEQVTDRTNDMVPGSGSAQGTHEVGRATAMLRKS